MCMYLTNGNFLGSRLIGYDFYDSKSKGFVGMSEKQIVNTLKKNERLYGFALTEEDGESRLVLDADNFNMVNLQVKSGVNTLGWLIESPDCDMNTALVVVAVYVENGKKTFETVNARHARVTYEESMLRMLVEVGVPVAGVRLEKNKLVACEGVEVMETVGNETA